MNGPRNKFFSRSRLSVDQHGGICRRYSFHALQDSAQRSAGSDDLGEIHFRADFIFQIQLFLRELVLQFPNFAVSKRILDRECNLVGNLSQDIDLVV